MAKQHTQRYLLKMTAEGLQELTKSVNKLNANLAGTTTAVSDTDKAFKGAKKAQDPYLRGLKGAGNATNNSTKAFSKMSQNMNGTLVPAYATVAANVFALTALFGALRRAADFDILTKSAETYAVQTGRSLIGLSKSMKAITNQAITMKEALTSASIAASAGFDNSTIEKLTQVARNASVALGRDMTDSLDRVFKGAIKAEPELLDELGIILRLDPAARKYAASIGKSVTALTTFEKQQAVVNEVIAQGEEKFSEFSDVDVNAFTQLGSAFTDISTILIQFISIPIVPVLTFLADNFILLTSIIVLFATSIAKRAFPALENFAETMETKFTGAAAAAETAAKKAAATNITWQKSLRATTSESQRMLTAFSKGVFQVQDVVENTGKKVSKQFSTAFQFGTDNVKGLEAYKKGIQGVLKAFDRGTKVSQGFKNSAKSIAFLKEELSETQLVLDGLQRKTISTQTRFQALGAGITATFTKARLSVIAFGATVSKNLALTALAGYQGGLTGIKTALAGIIGTTKGVTRVFSVLGATVAGVGGAFLKFLPIIGLLTAAWSILSSIFSTVKEALFGKELVDLNETLDNNIEALETAAKSAELYDSKLRHLPSTIDNTAKKTLLLANTFGTLHDNLSKTLEDIDILGGFTGLDSFLDAFGLGELDEFKDQLDSTVKTLIKFGEVDSANTILTKYNDLLKLSGENASKAGEELNKLLKMLRDTARGESELNTVLSEALEGLSKGLLAIDGGLPALTGAEQGFLNLQTILSTLDVKNVHLVASAISEMTHFELRELGLTDIAKEVSSINKPLDELNKNLTKAQVKLKLIQESRDKAAKLGDLELEVRTDKTEKDFNFLTQVINTLEAGISGITTRLKDQSAGIVTQLDKVKDRFQDIINAQKEIAAIRSQNAISNLEQGVGLEKRLSALKQLTDAENTYLETVSSQTQSSLTNIKDAVAEVTKKLEKVDLDKGTRAGLTKELEAGLGKQQQIENKLLDTKTKITANYIKQVKTLQSELKKTTRLSAAGLTVSKEQAKVVEDKLFAAFLKVGAIQTATSESAEVFARRMTASTIAVEKLSAFLQQARIPSTESLVSNISSLEARAEVLRVEADFLAEHNTLLSERIDKEFILAKAENERRSAAVQTELVTAISEDPEGSKRITELQNRLNALKLENAKLQEVGKSVLKAAATKKIKLLKDEIKFTKKILDQGALITKAKQDEIKLEKIRQDLIAKGHKKELDNIIKLTKEKQDQKFQEDFNKGIGETIENMSKFSSIINELNDNKDKLGKDDQITASFKSLGDVAAAAGDNVSKAFADMGLLVDTYSDKLSEGTLTARDWSSFTMSALGAMSQLFEEGSKEAQAFAAAQQVLAVVNAVASIAAAASNGDAYTAPARVALMLGLMSSVLGLAGISMGGAGGGDGGEQAYLDSVSEQGLVGQRDLQSNSLIDAIEGLVEIDTELFSSNRDLQLTLVNLGKTFSKIGGALFGAGGSFEATNILDLFGISFGSSGGGNFLSSRSTSNRLVDAGIELSATIDLVGGVITSSLDDATFFLVESITTSKKRLLGGSKSSTRLKTSLEEIGDSLDRQLQRAIGKIGTVVAGLFSSFTNVIDLNLSKLFGGLGSLIFENIKISLSGKDAEEQSESIAAFVSLLTTSLVERLLPAISLFSLAGEELLDTLIRITESIIQLEGSFNRLGVSISSYFDTASLEALDPNAIFEQAFGGAIVDTSFLDILGVRFTEIISFFEDVEAGSFKVGHTVLRLFKPEEMFKEILLKPEEIIAAIEAAIEAMKITIVAAWEDAFLANFKDFEEFTSIFQKFSETLYSESELAQLALENAENTVNSGFELLRSSLEALGDEDLLDLLAGGNTEEVLRAIFEMGNASGAFAARFDEATGEIDTSGADLLALLIQLGAAMGYQEDAAEELIDAMDNLNQQYERQIATFGLLGKELELLELSFDFEDALIEAAETGTDLALVETYYGLLRLDIVREYNQEIVDLIEEGMGNINDSILSVLQSAEGWDEVAYQSIQVTKLVDKLSASLGNLGSGIDFSVFSDLSDTSEFLETLESFINITVGSGESITDQILLVEELRTAVVARYDAEVSAAEELEGSINDSISALKDLSAEIGDFLDDLFVGDLSPLTNAQKLGEAQLQFDENLRNVLSQDEDIASRAREDLLESASTLLELANLFWAIGPEYQSIFNDVVGSLESIDQSILDEIGMSEEALAIQSLESTLTELQLQTISQLQTLDSILVALEEQNTIDLNNELSLYAPQIITSLDTITTKLEQVNTDSWNPILQQLILLNTTMNNLSSFSSGAEEIGFDQVAMIHKGETILTADTSEAIRSGETIYGSADAISSNVSSGSNADVVDAIRVLTQVLATGQEDIIDKSEEIRQATSEISTDINVSRPASAKGII